MHAIITGGNRGIGAAIAQALSATGATLTLMGRDQAKLEETARSLGGSVTTLQCDVSDVDSVNAAFKSAVEANGTPYALINNAGQADAATIEETTVELWQRMLDVNLTGTFLCTRAVIESMKSAGTGRIINIASVAGLKGAPRITAYCASKHGVIGFTRALAMELARTGITVNAVCPTYTDTEMTDRTLNAVASRRNTNIDGARELLERTIPIGRLITPEEVAAAVLYLYSNAAASITGQAIAVDGGESQ